MFANNSDSFFDAQQSSVIVRSHAQPGQTESSDDSYVGTTFQPSSYLPTPLTPGYQSYGGFPFPFAGLDFTFFPPPTTDPNCSNQLGPSSLNSPINITTSALGGSLNPLQPRFGGRTGLPYDLSGNGVTFMGGAKPRKGGRHPREEMDDMNDPEEVEKRLKRRQRNKEAAARCRQRRLDLMQTLQEQVTIAKEENTRKEEEIRSIKSKLDSLIDFLKKHDCQMPDSERQNLNNIINMYSIHPSVIPVVTTNHHPNIITTSAPIITQPVFKMEPSSPPMASDYQPLAGTRTTVLGKRLPNTSDVNLLEPESKFQKPSIVMDKTLSQVNGGAESSEVSRPTSLDFSGISRGGHVVPITTPSRGDFQLPSQPPTFSTFTKESASSFMGGSESNFFLNQPTGLTPSGAPTGVSFVQTPTPLQNTESELRSL